MSPMRKNILWIGMLVAASSVVAIQLDLPVSDDANVNQKNTCAMTQVLQAMNELLTLQSAEIRELKKQVQNSCAGKQAGKRPASAINIGSDDDDDDLFGSDFDIFKDNDKGKDDGPSFPSISGAASSVPEDNLDNEEEVVPAEDLINGISKWWDTILPFAPKPEKATTTTTTTTTTTSTPAPPPFPAFPDYDTLTKLPDPDYYEFKSPLNTSDSTTSEPPMPYTLPPEPDNCPQPFRLQGSGCYLIFQDQREWRSWGEAHAFCQSYGGSLAAPWRFRELQDFLSRYYSDAFWVGASFDSSIGSWQWLSGRRVENSAWKRGQPNRNPGMKCVFLDKWSGYKANNFFCGEKYPFICEYIEV